MPRGQQAPLSERLQKGKEKLEKTETAYKKAKDDYEKLLNEENNNLMKEVTALAKAEKMTVTEYLKKAVKK